MVTSISRHGFPTDSAAVEGDAARIKSVSRMLDRLEESEMSRSRALSSTLNVAKSYCATDPRGAKFPTWEGWVTAMQVGSALFASATAPGDTVACRIGSGGEVKNLPAISPASYTHAGAWVTSFYLAVICRENERLNQLAQVPVSLLRESGAVFDEFIYSWVETLQSFWFGRQDVSEKLVAAVDGTDPQVVGTADAEQLLKIPYPPLNLFYLYLNRDTERFNEALVEALTWHKEYWTADEARSLSGDGLVALGPLAIACLAYDVDMPIEVESDYLPSALLKRNWIGEFDT